MQKENTRKVVAKLLEAITAAAKLGKRNLLGFILRKDEMVLFNKALTRRSMP